MQSIIARRVLARKLFLEMTHSVEVQNVARFLLVQEKFLNKMELTFAKSIMVWLPYNKQNVNSEGYLVALRAKELRSHRQHALFAIDLFEACGAEYATV